MSTNGDIMSEGGFRPTGSFRVKQRKISLSLFRVNNNVEQLYSAYDVTSRKRASRRLRETIVTLTLPIKTK